MTFYKSVTDLTLFDSYDMKGRRYRFFTGEPLYPFGHGLSYTTFAYSSLRTNTDSATTNDTVTVSVDVTNTGRRIRSAAAQIGSPVAYAQLTG